MEIEETLKQLLTQILDKTGLEYGEILISEEENKNYHINIESSNPSALIGHHGDNIQALQHLLKILAWKNTNNDGFNILLDVDNYRKRQEENAIRLADRKISQTRKTGRAETLPPMSPYLRRKIHLHCMQPGFEDIETYSKGEGDKRYIVLKLK